MNIAKAPKGSRIMVFRRLLKITCLRLLFQIILITYLLLFVMSLIALPTMAEFNNKDQVTGTITTARHFQETPPDDQTSKNNHKRHATHNDKHQTSSKKHSKQEKTTDDQRQKAQSQFERDHNSSKQKPKNKANSQAS